MPKASHWFALSKYMLLEFGAMTLKRAEMAGFTMAEDLKLT